MKRRGSTYLETALFLPILFMLLFGMVEFARIGWTYFTLNKMLYTLGRYVGTQQGVNFCDENDPQLLAAKYYALTGSTDNSTDPFLPNLTADLVRVSIERYSADSGSLGDCDCSSTGCDAASGGRPPDYIVVTIPDGYSVRANIPFAPMEGFLLRPHIRLPYGGT